MKKLFTTLLLFTCISQLYAQSFNVDTLYKTGPLDNRINIVILGDGFTEAELPKFRQEAKKFADFFLNYAPYNKYKSYFNFFTIPTASQESGVTNPGTAPDAYPDQPVGKKKTYYSASFGSSIHRLVTVNFGVTFNVLAANFPAYDLVIMLVNTTYYGGSGGSIAVHTLNQEANRIGVHEIGHTFGSLNDEYWAGPQYGWEAANMTMVSDPGSVKWKNWLNAKGIGVYKHGDDGEARNWHKPANGACLMEYLSEPFCVVCREATTERILSIVNPVEKVEPDTSSALMITAPTDFKLGLLEPEAPSSLQVTWTLDGEPLKTGSDQVSLRPADIPGTATLTATIFDSTHMSRSKEMQGQRMRVVNWELKSNSPAILKVLADMDTICAGGSVILTAKGCAATVSWSGGETGNIITVNPASSATYTATCQASGQTANVKITVLPIPNATASNTGPYLEGASIRLRADGGSDYAWSGPGNFAATGQTVEIQNATEQHSGTYSVLVTDSHGCKDTASTVVKVDPILGVGNDPADWVRISPNPASDYIQVKTSFSGRSSMTIYDVSGKALLTKTFVKETEIPLNATTGLYVYRLSNGKKEISGKLLIR